MEVILASPTIAVFPRTAFSIGHSSLGHSILPPGLLPPVASLGSTLLEMTSPVAQTVYNPPANAGDSGSIPGSGGSPGEGNGHPPQYSWLENSMERGAWWTKIHGVSKSQTRLSNYTFFHSDPQDLNDKATPFLSLLANLAPGLPSLSPLGSSTLLGHIFSLKNQTLKSLGRQWPSLGRKRD